MNRLLSVLFLCVATPLAAQETLVNNTYDPKTGTRVVVTALISKLPTSGYMPVRVSLRNGGKIDRTWSFRFRSFDYGYSDDGNEMRSDFSGSCNAGQVASYEFLVPLVTAFQQGFSPSTELELTVSATAYPSLSANMSADFDPRWPSVFMSSSLFTKNIGPLTAEVSSHVSSGSGYGGGGATSVTFTGQFDPKQLSDQWQAYSGYDHCFVTDDEWRSISPGARSALLQWNRLGGSLLICSSDSAVDLNSLGITMSKPGIRDGLRSWGVAQIVPIPSSGSLNPLHMATLVTVDIPTIRGANRAQSLREDFSSAWPIHILFKADPAHIIFFILILVAFGVLVGPVNLFVFAKSGQRHRLFVTTPIISLGASLLLILLIVFQDGFGGSGKRLILMEVRSDNSENAAFLSQEQIARTGVLFGTGFTTSEPAYLTPVLIEESRWARVTQGNDGGNSRYQMDVQENGLKVAGDWFQSRSEHGHLAEAIRPTRGRIELVSADPAPVITSTFEFPLETLYYAAPDGTFWIATDVSQGRKTPLSEVPAGQFDAWIDNEATLFSARNRKRLQMTARRTGHFIATSEDVPGIETLTSLSWKDSHAVITGSVSAP